MIILFKIEFISKSEFLSFVIYDNILYFAVFTLVSNLDHISKY